MSDQEDKYREESEGGTQIRSIINRLNEERPSKEKSREVVVRADGSKVIRVTKKRRVSVTEQEKKRRSRKAFVSGLLAAFLILAAMAAFFGFRLSAMAGEGYLQDSVAALKEAWGATDIRVSGKGINGRDFHLDSLVAEFPADSMVERVEFSGIDAKLDTFSFFAKKLMAQQVTMARAEIQLRQGAEKLEIRAFKGDDLWSFHRVECADFSVKWPTASGSSVAALSGARAYLYHPRLNDWSSCVLNLEGGVLQLGSWKTIYLKDGKVHVAPDRVEEFHLVGSVNRPTEKEETNVMELSISGRMKTGDALVGPFTFNSDNMPLADFTDSRFEQFFSARTLQVPDNRSKATITLSTEGNLPEFNGEFALKGICLSGMPAQVLMTDHIVPAKRRLYLPPRVSRGYGIISHADGGVSLELPDGGAVERDLLTMKGKMTISAANELSGNMSYALPVSLTRVEYTDGMSDPIFREDGQLAWLATELSGMANVPTDNSAEVDKGAEDARRRRPARIPFDKMDIERYAQEAQKESAKLRETFEQDSTAPTIEASAQDKTDTEDPFAEKPNSNDPFALPTPF